LRPELRELTGEALDVTIKLVGEQHAGAYPASLFKNASKCRSLAKAALADEPQQVSAQLPLLEVD